MIGTGEIQRPRQVLVVDDQEINRDALEVILEEKYEILFAENGQEALEKMHEHQQSLCLMLLDLMMPVMNGFEVLEAVRGEEQLRHIPVIVLTADRSAELKALQLGAADFITKPFDMPEIILARVERIIDLSEGRKLISAAEHDRLTGLYTMAFFFEYIDRLYRYHREMKLDAAVINVEKFHSVTAISGREFCDNVLRVIGEEIRAFLSENDGIAGRGEADRFYLYCAPQADYRELLRRFQKRVSRLSRKVNVHLRMGVTRQQDGVEPALLFDRARVACNMARGDYQNPLVIYDEEMRQRELLNQHLLNGLRPAAEERQFIVYYQPKYDIQCNPPRLVSAEALIRWKHPELGMIAPDTFVPLFEGNGLIGVADNYVWQEAARQAAEWKKKYHITLPVSVNLSRADVYDPALEEQLTRLIEENGLDYGDIKLEVTESAYTDNAQTVLTVIRRLRERGFQVEMDDFGSGYSSLNMLSEMPVDVIKMDMKFVRNIEKSETDRRLVTLIPDLARYLRVPVVAEGVETEGQLEILRQGECDYVQGYYFSRPLPPAEFEMLIQKEIQKRR